MYALCHCETIGDPRVDFQGDSSGVPNGVSIGVYPIMICAQHTTNSIYGGIQFWGVFKNIYYVSKILAHNLAINIISEYIPCHKLLFFLL